MELLTCNWYSSSLLIFSGNVGPLIYYTHALPIIVSLILGVFVLLNNKRGLLNIVLFFITLSFAFWVYFDLILWASPNPEAVMFFWNSIIPVEMLMYAGCLYFVLILSNKQQDISLRKKIYIALFFIPIVLFAHTRFNVIGLAPDCDTGAIEGPLIHYMYLVEWIFIIWAILATLKGAKNELDVVKKHQSTYLSIGAIVFMFVFALGNISLLFSFDPLYEQYKLFSMPIFAAVVTYSIVRFKAFNAKLFAAQVLVVSLEVLIISLLFIRTIANIRIITIFTFVITVIVGSALVRSFKRIDTQRELLEKANAEQEVLMHFITHQIKGFFTKSRNIFDTISDESEALSPGINRLVQEGLRSDKEGIDLVQNILNASNLKSGKITFVDNFFDMDLLVKGVLKDLDASTKSKNLTVNYYCTTTPINVKADEARIKDVVRNLIQNAILYTFKGGVNISLTQKDTKVEFVVKDTGIGLTESDKARLFQSGGRGEESVKYNTSSTGYGLFIAKKIVDNYNGQAWAESDGRDKGSKFSVVLPIAQTLLK